MMDLTGGVYEEKCSRATRQYARNPRDGRSQLSSRKRRSRDLESPKPYELAIDTSSDAIHYQITLKRPPDMNDESTWCETASFSDDAGLIFLGAAINCKTSGR
jgi:hypothetical protein